MSCVPLLQFRFGSRTAAHISLKPNKQEAHKKAPQTRKPACVMSGRSLSAFVMKNAATVAVPTKSHVENFSMGLLALKLASNIDDTMAFSAFWRARLFHSRSDSVLESSVM